MLFQVFGVCAPWLVPFLLTYPALCRAFSCWPITAQHVRSCEIIPSIALPVCVLYCGPAQQYCSALERRIFHVCVCALQGTQPCAPTTIRGCFGHGSAPDCQRLTG